MVPSSARTRVIRRFMASTVPTTSEVSMTSPMPYWSSMRDEDAGQEVTDQLLGTEADGDTEDTDAGQDRRNVHVQVLEHVHDGEGGHQDADNAAEQRADGVWPAGPGARGPAPRNAGATQRKCGFLKNVLPSATRLVIPEITKDATSHTATPIPKADEGARQVDGRNVRHVWRVMGSTAVMLNIGRAYSWLLFPVGLVFAVGLVRGFGPGVRRPQATLLSFNSSAQAEQALLAACGAQSG